MVLPDNLLNPIPGDNPSGACLRYKETSKRDPTHFYDKLEEARREEDAVNEWQEAGKKADYDLVIKLATDALQSRTKDVWIASRLTEALLKKHGYEGFREGIDLMRGLIENFWDTLYPEIEDGDAELRAMPVDWIASRFGVELKKIPVTRPKPPITKTGFNWYDWDQSSRIPKEEEAAESDGAKAKRDEAIADKKATPEEFNEAFTATKKADYKAWSAELEAVQESIDSLDGVAREKFGDLAPSFEDLRLTVENDLKRAMRTLLKLKLEADPDPVETVEVSEPAQAEEIASGQEGTTEETASAAAPATRHGISAEPADRDDAIKCVVAVASYLRQQEPYSPVPYLMLRGVRWGELRASGGSIDQLLCEAPPTEIRRQIKRASLELNWAEVLEAAEKAMGMPCGRAWLDLNRYVVKACAELGSYYDPIAAAVRSEIKALLADYPQLAEMTLMDDTPTANAETLAWLREEIIPPPAAPAEPAQTPELEIEVPAMAAQDEPGEETAKGPPDPYELASDAARHGRTAEAVSILADASSQERSGRARFHRKVQLAGICMATGNEAIAYPILEELSNEVERRKLEEWEAPDAIAQPLALLYKCLASMGRDDAEKQKVYDRICRLDPAQAINCLK